VSPETLAPVSVEEFWHLAHQLSRAELVAGRVVELTPPGLRHGVVAAAVVDALRGQVTRRGLGVVATETGFILSRDPATVRAPDVAVVLQGRLGDQVAVRFFPGAPDLAVEVLSPDDRPGEIAAKVADYLQAGTAAVWIVDPEAETVTVHTRGVALRYGPEEEVSGAPVLPDLRIAVRDLLR
jgi:Uma2 family endonuclease